MAEIISPKKGQNDFQKAKLAATAKARSELINRHQEEYDLLLEQYMAEAGYTPKTVTKTTWEKNETPVA